MIKTQPQLSSLRFPHHATPADWNIPLPHVPHGVDMSPRTVHPLLTMQTNVRSKMSINVFWYFQKQISLPEIKKTYRWSHRFFALGILKPEGCVCSITCRTRTFFPEPMRCATCRLRGERFSHFFLSLHFGDFYFNIIIYAFGIEFFFLHYYLSLWEFFNVLKLYTVYYPFGHFFTNVIHLWMTILYCLSSL